MSGREDFKINWNYKNSWEQFNDFKFHLFNPY